MAITILILGEQAEFSASTLANTVDLSGPAWGKELELFVTSYPSITCTTCIVRGHLACLLVPLLACPSPSAPW